MARHFARHSLRSVAEHFRRDPVVISEGLGKLISRLREKENLRERINKLGQENEIIIKSVSIKYFIA